MKLLGLKRHLLDVFACHIILNCIFEMLKSIRTNHLIMFAIFSTYKTKNLPMKKYFILLIIVTLCLGCQVEPLDPSLRANLPVNGVTASNIIGSWDFEDYEVTSTVTATILGNTITQTTVTSLVSTNAVITFNADGTYVVTGNATVELESDGTSLGNQSVPVNDTGRFVVNGNRLEMTSNSPGNAGARLGSVSNQMITVLTATDLRITVDFEANENVAGATTRTEINGFYEFTRQ